MEIKNITFSCSEETASELITLLSVASSRAYKAGAMGLADTYERLRERISEELEKVFLK